MSDVPNEPALSAVSLAEQQLTCKGSTLDPTKKYELAREQIRHEDGLINNRTTWFLVFQGLLFGAFFQALGRFEGANFPHPELLVFALSVLCFVGAASALVAASAVRVANKQISKLRDWWEQQALANTFPPLMGTQGIYIRRLDLRITGADFLAAFAVVWLVLAFLLQWGAWHVPRA